MYMHAREKKEEFEAHCNPLYLQQKVYNFMRVQQNVTTQMYYVCVCLRFTQNCEWKRKHIMRKTFPSHLREISLEVLDQM